MKKQLLFLLFALVSITLCAQNSESILVDEQPVSEKEFYDIKNNGWSIIKFQGLTLLGNFSNKDYVLRLNINCNDVSKKPSFLIEYSNNYRDGKWGGVDFISSKSNDLKMIVFFIDDQEFKNPFIEGNEGALTSFKEAIKNGKTLKIKFFNTEYNPDIAKDELKLNREVGFTLKNSHLLATPVTCN